MMSRMSLMMSIYFCIFAFSNSSFCLCSGNALQSSVLRLREDIFLVDAGLGTPRICMQDELTGVPINRATRFENKAGFLDVVAGESLIKKRILERLFINLVAGESLIKERAAARFNSLVGSTDVVAGEPLLLLPRRFRQNRAWMELNKIWRTNTKVKGFIIEKVKGGYSVAIAGFITFLPFRRLNKKRKANDRFTIESMNPKRRNIVVWCSNSGTNCTSAIRYICRQDSGSVSFSRGYCSARDNTDLKKEETCLAKGRDVHTKKRKKIIFFFLVRCMLERAKLIGAGAAIGIGNLFRAFLNLVRHFLSYVYMRFLFLYLENAFLKHIVYVLIVITFHFVFFTSSIAFCEDSPSASEVAVQPTTKTHPSENYIILDNYLRFFPTQSQHWVTFVRERLSEARAEDFEATVQNFLRIESCAYASRSIEDLFCALYYNANYVPLAPNILKAGVKEMLVRYQIIELESLNQVVRSLQDERELSPFFCMTMSGSEIINEAQQTQLREAAEAAQREVAFQDLVFKKQAIEGRLGILIDENHKLFGDIVAAEMRKPPR